MALGAADLASAALAVFFVGVIWLRTRLHYAGRRMSLKLTRAGRIYFAAVLAVLVIGWFFAPSLGRSLWPAAASPGGLGPNPTLTRVIWFLATYYVFLVVHRALHGHHIEVFGERG